MHAHKQINQWCLEQQYKLYALRNTKLTCSSDNAAADLHTCQQLTDCMVCYSCKRNVQQGVRHDSGECTRVHSGSLTVAPQHVQLVINKHIYIHCEVDIHNPAVPTYRCCHAIAAGSSPNSRLIPNVPALSSALKNIVGSIIASTRGGPNISRYNGNSPCTHTHTQHINE
jgi:hypothetical protein